MLKFRRSTAAPPVTPDDRPLTDRPDLRVGNLLDDPALRRAMGLDQVPRPTPRFDRRRLLERAAA